MIMMLVIISAVVIITTIVMISIINMIEDGPGLGAKDCTPEIKTSEIIVDFLCLFACSGERQKDDTRGSVTEHKIQKSWISVASSNGLSFSRDLVSRVASRPEGHGRVLVAAAGVGTKGASGLSVVVACVFLLLCLACLLFVCFVLSVCVVETCLGCARACARARARVRALHLYSTMEMQTWLYTFSYNINIL